ncbi:MAG: hypothetical protein WKF96_17090 [Solirubrobacteraceae bacterium]
MSTKTAHTGTEALERALDNLDPGAVKVSDPAELRAIAEHVDQIEATRRLIDAAVVAARAAGYSWARIALALNVSRQAAHERYSGITPDPEAVNYHGAAGKVTRTAP